MATKTTGAAADVAAERMEVEHGGEWQAGVLGGLVGGAVMGVLLTLLARPVIEVAMPALVGLTGGLYGWLVHMTIAAVFGVVFAAIVTRPSLRQYAENASRATVAGLVYGVVLWVVAAGIVMPLWLAAVGFAGAPPVFGTLTVAGLVAHLGYGIGLGATYLTFVRIFRPESAPETELPGAAD